MCLHPAERCDLPPSHRSISLWNRVSGVPASHRVRRSGAVVGRSPQLAAHKQQRAVQCSGVKCRL